jgi:NAD(P)-dependent dehydrogenase (short-subunit alcohol dehydrogenase family)
MYNKLFDLSKKVILITGGGGHLGRELSIGISDFHAQVIAVGRKKSTFNSKKIEYIECDLKDEWEFEKVVKGVLGRYGKIDGLINNANSSNRESWEELNSDGWRDGFEGTLTHVFTCSKIISRHMKTRGQGVIVNNASIFGMLAPDFSIYPEGIRGPAPHHAAAKAGVIQLTKYLAAELARDGIRVNSVTPGWFPKKKGPERLDFMSNLEARIPMARIGQPKELVGAFVYLLSNASSYVTGHNLIVDGGYSIL